MDFQEKKVYQFLLSQPGYGFLSDMYDPEGFSKADFLRACSCLVREGYAVRIKAGYALTHEGIHKRERDFREFVKAFFSRFLVGVAVGVSGTVIAEVLLRVVQSQ